MLDFTCAHLLIKAKGKYRHEVLKQKVELNFLTSGVELLQNSSTLVRPWTNVLPLLRTLLNLLHVSYC